MRQHLVHLCILGLPGFLMACGEGGILEASKSPVVAAQTVAPPVVVPGPIGPLPRVACLMPIDEDGDGIGDVFGPNSPIVHNLLPTACYGQGGTILKLLPGGSDRASDDTAANGAGAGAGATTDASADASASASTVAPATTGYREGPHPPPLQLQLDVRATGVHEDAEDKYDPPEYDCEDFANDLEEALTDMGYEATYTERCIPGNPATWHAITDIHIDGLTYWFEPQTGKPVTMDGNGDGTVQTSTSGSPCDRATEGRFGVRVWGSLEERVQELGLPD